MALSKKARLVTTKIGQRYETYYYYKQKVVNWEYIAPEGYQTPVFIDASDSDYLNNKSAIISEPLVGSFSVLKHITEDLIKKHKIHHTITAVNNMPTVWSIHTSRYEQENNNIELVSTDILDATKPSVIKNIDSVFDNLHDAVFLNERWYIQSKILCKFGPQYEYGIYHIAAPHLNFFQDVYIDQLNFTDEIFYKDLQLVQYADILKLPTTNNSVIIDKVANISYHSSISTQSINHSKLCRMVLYEDIPITTSMNNQYIDPDASVSFLKDIYFISALK